LAAGGDTVIKIHTPVCTVTKASRKRVVWWTEQLQHGAR